MDLEEEPEKWRKHFALLDRHEPISRIRVQGHARGWFGGLRRRNERQADIRYRWSVRWATAAAPAT